MSESDFSARKKIFDCFETALFGSLVSKKNSKTFSNERVPFGQFLCFLSNQEIFIKDGNPDLEVVTNDSNEMRHHQREQLFPLMELEKNS